MWTRYISNGLKILNLKKNHTLTKKLYIPKDNQ